MVRPKETLNLFYFILFFLLLLAYVRVHCIWDLHGNYRSIVKNLFYQNILMSEIGKHLI